MHRPGRPDQGSALEESEASVLTPGAWGSGFRVLGLRHWVLAMSKPLNIETQKRQSHKQSALCPMTIPGECPEKSSQAWHVLFWKLRLTYVHWRTDPKERLHWGVRRPAGVESRLAKSDPNSISSRRGHKAVALLKTLGLQTKSRMHAGFRANE